MNSWAITDKGITRAQNQDAYYSYCDPDNSLALCIVCDGMGGANAGNVASKMAVEGFVEELNEFCSKTHYISTKEMMREVARKVNRRIFDKSIDDSSLRGMGTTLVAALISEDNAAIINIGDSRAYHITPDSIHQITKDHSVVEELIDRGDITRDEARHHPNRNLITRAVGTSPSVEADHFTLKINDGDYILLCSDGLTNIVTDEEIHSIIYSDIPPDNYCKELVDLVLKRGAPDNITVVLFRK